MSATDPGPRDHLVTRALRAMLDQVEAELLLEEPLDSAEGPERLARHAMEQIRRDLAGEESSDTQVSRVNALLGDLTGGGAEDSQLEIPPQVLLGIRARSPLGDLLPLPVAPATPLSQSDLLINAEGQPNIGSELRAELASAESVDLICAFVIWSGVRHLRDALADVIGRGGRIRVVTTTYMGATEKRAVDELVSLGAEVRVAFDARTTKLHAKAWLLERASGLSTAFVGSSNLSHTALFDGLEWNVRLSEVDALPPEIPLTLHARYSRNEIIAALGNGDGVKPKVTQGGILWAPEAQSDVFFVDLHKAERDYSPTTMYRDYAVNRELFHWESQSRQTAEQPTVQRYINHQAQGSRVLLFVRERKYDKLGTQPFYFLGPVSYVDHRGEKPVSFTWRLPQPMPEDLFEVARSVAAA